MTPERLAEIRDQAVAPRPSPLASDVLALVAEVRAAWADCERLQRDLDAAIEVMAGGETPPKLAQVLRACGARALADRTAERDRLAVAVREAVGRLEALTGLLADCAELRAVLTSLREALAGCGEATP